MRACPGHLIRLALSLPPRIALAKAAGFARRLADRHIQGWLRRDRCSYPPSPGRLCRCLDTLDVSIPDSFGETRLLLEHRFDLLGSGPVRVTHGQRYNGFGPHRYGPHPPLLDDWRGAVAAGLNPGNRARARAILDLIPDSYDPIDWHVDFVSGFRWSPATWGGGIAYAHLPGVDVKLPWELARMQHLPRLALLADAGTVAALAAEFRAQALDFIGSNPPGWGVNWACAMDVAIRAVNLILAWEMFRARGAAFDETFETELAASLLAHGRHVMAHLEWSELHRGNHYLADICGLAVIAHALPDSPESVEWRHFAAAELNAEILRQFTPDGANFEASTAYHRLSAEMATVTAALLLGRGERLSGEAMARLAGAARFAADVAKPSGEMIQVGDNDSGRFVRLEAGDRPLDMAPVIAAAKGLFELDLPSPPHAEPVTRVVAALAGGRRFAAPPPARPALPAGPAEDGPCLRLRIKPPDPAALSGLEAIAYPDFGLFLWRNARTFVAVRCGPIGQNGQGGHAHNDQLSVEIEIDGVAWARDPGSFVYTADLAERDRYRSVMAHFAPRRGRDEPARLLAPFRLEDRAHAEPIRFGDDFVGRHMGFGSPVWRRVAIEDGAIVIEDRPGEGEHLIRSPDDLARLWGLILPFSPGYGRKG
ncbi:heparinase II/III family protein [Magnetospirillum sp. SS-4]|uniref:heparinase II/III family protein n=1 Tax=Magnetospirillum sp. SS-4 TaxID=2681465 RepID=UPI0013808F32|nr:heparinase II/III family protein [Magnetospirillum sp. SS-4]CAA7612242.1 conserved hypothetical protein [Magnetospirillum sp. SS-4]